MTEFRRPKVGDYVTILTGVTRRLRGFTIAYVCETTDQVDKMRKRIGMPWITPDSLFENERGTVWALGTEGPEVDALKAATALL